MTYEVRHQVQHTRAIKVRPRVHIATLPNCKCSTMQWLKNKVSTKLNKTRKKSFQKITYDCQPGTNEA